MLLFGGSKLPQLAKALGQSKRAFKEGMDEAEEEEQRDRTRASLTAGQQSQPSLSAVDDEALFEEARRRAARLRATENSPAQLEDDKSASSPLR
jgi:TatA/E family protein of Tat protein translocase